MLNKKKNKNMGKCPFRNLKACSNDCAFYREGVRFTEQTGESFPFADCAFNIIADNLEAMHNRTYMLQKEVGETKNVMAMKILSELGHIDPNETERVAMKIIDLPKEDKKSLESSDDKKLIDKK
jgi:hypothetical protein